MQPSNKQALSNMSKKRPLIVFASDSENSGDEDEELGAALGNLVGATDTAPARSVVGATEEDSGDAMDITTTLRNPQSSSTNDTGTLGGDMDEEEELIYAALENDTMDAPTHSDMDQDEEYFYAALYEIDAPTRSVVGGGTTTTTERVRRVSAEEEDEDSGDAMDITTSTPRNPQRSSTSHTDDNTVSMTSGLLVGGDMMDVELLTCLPVMPGAQVRTRTSQDQGGNHQGVPTRANDSTAARQASNGADSSDDDDDSSDDGYWGDKKRPAMTVPKKKDTLVSPNEKDEATLYGEKKHGKRPKKNETTKSPHVVFTAKLLPSESSSSSESEAEPPKSFNQAAASKPEEEPGSDNGYWGDKKKPAMAVPKKDARVTPNEKDEATLLGEKKHGKRPKKNETTKSPPVSESKDEPQKRLNRATAASKPEEGPGSDNGYWGDKKKPAMAVPKRDTQVPPNEKDEAMQGKDNPGKRPKKNETTQGIVFATNELSSESSLSLSSSGQSDDDESQERSNQASAASKRDTLVRVPPNEKDEATQGEENPGKRLKKNETTQGIVFAANDLSSESSSSLSSSEKEDESQERSNQATSASEPEEEPGTLERDYDPQVGDRVYAEFPLDGKWYWGHVSECKRYQSSRQCFYSIDFEDGDKANRVSRGKIRTVLEYQKEFGTAVVVKDQDPVVGDRVYAYFEDDEVNGWFWGKVRKVTKKKQNHHGLGDKPDTLQAIGSNDDTRLAEDCCFVPARPPKQKDDGTFARPCGRSPPGMVWDARRGLYSPLSGVDSSTEEDLPVQSGQDGVAEDTVSSDHLFSIDFDDGDKANDLPREKVRTVWEFQQEFGIDPPFPVENGNGAVLSPHELYDARCKRCELCKKQDCGTCTSCRNNKQTSFNPDEREVCLQKMCLKLSQSRKKQPAKGLPPEWSFLFSCNTPFRRKNTKVYTPGLFISHRDHPSQIFRSVEAAASRVKKLKEFNPNVVDEFNTHIGVKLTGEAKGGANDRAEASPSSSGDGVPLSPRDMYDRCCNQCELCLKPDCGSCTSCQNNKRASLNHIQREVCLQKMCLHIPDPQKKQQAKGLSSGWTFVFARDTPYVTKSGQAHVPGLFIHHPECNTNFRSIEAAVAYCPKLKDFNPNVIAEFNNHIGVIAEGKGKRDSEKKAEPSASPSGADVPLNPHQMYIRRCDQCELCLKPDCGSCSSCKNNRKAPGRRHAVCLQKMCLEIPVSQKKQPAKGLPPGWTFIFAHNTRYGHGSTRDYTPGLFISHRDYPTQTFRSIAAASSRVKKLKEFNPNVVEDFNAHIGIGASTSTGGNKRKTEQNGSSVAVSRKPKPSPPSTGSLSYLVEDATGLSLGPQEMYARRCNECELCTKPDCGSCASCRSNNRASSNGTREVCLQKMCLRIPDSRKKQHAKGMPPGWTYIFEKDRKYKGRRSYVPGLFILHPTKPAQIYRSAEGAVNTVPALRKANPSVIKDFYEHVGIKTTDLVAPDTMKNPSFYQESLELPPVAPEACSSTPSTSITTSNGPCGVCENCTKDACGKCETCTNSPDGTSPHCFQKMCYELPVDAKAEPAFGFPKGWTFYFAEDPGTHGAYTFEPVHGLFILSKGKKKFRSVEAATDVCVVGDEREVARKFYTHVGLPHELESDRGQLASRPRKKQRTDNSLTITDYSLVGRGVCFAWTDVSGQTKIVYGKVAQCEEDENGEVPVDKFKVVYSPQSRNDSGCASTVPESQVLSLPSILGGCISLEQQTSATRQSSLMNRLRNKYEFLNWIVPNWRKEDQVVIANAQRLPRLVLFVRGYRLELYVKQSSIPNAGYGVFLKCTSLTNGHDGRQMGPLVLEAGELIDLGVYGPFDNQDVKKKAVFFVKNFIHSHKCEEWAFDFGDSQYEVDITDDVTGDIHSEARKHIHAYVNESNLEGKVCIRAEHDPEGSVHYLLGHPHQDQGSLVVPLNGDGMEVFVHYQGDYEKVRVRKGYSFLPDGEKKDRLLEEIANDDVEDVKHMDEMNAVDVKSCVEFLSELVRRVDFYSSNIIDRTLIVAAILQRRAKRIQDDDNSDANMNTVFERSSKLVSLLLAMIPGGELEGLQAERKVDQVLIRILKTQFSEHDQSKFSEMMR